ncbi:MAG: Two-component system sensor histidine kinase, partial [uncultured Thermoleophilia bacterium]
LVLGVAVRGFRERSSAERRATALAAARDEHAREAVAEERARLARELHDVVSHSVAVMIVQAEAGDVLLDDDPARARSALRSIAASGRDALLDLRRLLGVLRAEEGAAALGPQPGVGAIESLLDDVRAAGLDVDLAVEGRPEPLPVALDLSAYRIVQEGLTNVIRHAGGARARVTLRYEDGRLGVEVSDDGHAPASPAGAAGRGLIGVRERVALYGGEVEAGPRADGGFTLRAVLPLDRSPA